MSNVIKYYIEVEELGLIEKLKEYGKCEIVCTRIEKIIEIETTLENILKIEKIKGIKKIKEVEEDIVVFVK